MALKRMDNVLIVVDDLAVTKAFFTELGLTLEGETTVEGAAVGKLIGLEEVRATLAMMRTPDGQGIELDKFHTPQAVRFGPAEAPINTLGIRRLMFAVDDISAIVARMVAHGAELIGEMQYENAYRLAYIRGPEGIICRTRRAAERCGQSSGLERQPPGTRFCAMNPDRFPQLVRRIYAAVAELEQMFPGRPFTPDGHMVGSLGEALAAYYYGVRLYPGSAHRHDGVVDGCQVQIKTTQGASVTLSSEPDYLLVLRLNEDGSFTEEYNGPGEAVWSLVSLKPRPRNGQYQVRLSHLRKLMKLVSAEEKIDRVVA